MFKIQGGNPVFMGGMRGVDGLRVGPALSCVWCQPLLNGTVSSLDHFLVASPVYPYVMISAAQARESDDLRHTMSPFSLFLSPFSGTQRILGYVRPRRVVAVHPPKRGKRKPHLWAAFGGAFRLGSFCATLWRNLPLNVVSNGCTLWIETQHVCFLCFRKLMGGAGSSSVMQHTWAGWGQVAINQTCRFLSCSCRDLPTDIICFYIVFHIHTPTQTLHTLTTDRHNCIILFC